MAIYDISLDQIRDAIWNCIDNYSGFADFFNRKYKFEDSADIQPVKTPEPVLSDLPAIQVQLRAINPEWITFKKNEQAILWDITIWTKLWNQQSALEAWDLLFTAIYQTAHSEQTGETYISADSSANPPGTCFVPPLFRLSQSFRTETNLDERGNGTRVWVTQSELVTVRHVQPLSVS